MSLACLRSRRVASIAGGGQVEVDETRGPRGRETGFQHLLSQRPMHSSKAEILGPCCNLMQDEQNGLEL